METAATGNFSWREALRSVMKGKILIDEPLKDHTSMGVGGTAAALAYPLNGGELRALVDFLRTNSIPFCILGNGTNVIFGDGGFPGAVVAMEELSSLSLAEGTGPKGLLRAEAGAGLGNLVELACRNGLTGLEFCAGIPGTVGGALMMNAGAFGQTMSDCVVGITIIAPAGDISYPRRSQLEFSYRKLHLPEGAVIQEAEFALEKADEKAILARIRENLSWRRERHPLEYRSAGSIFKNPVGQPAGQIIDRLGLKGRKIGDAQVSRQHGNFIVNLGRARAEDVITLIEEVKKTVREATGIHLEEEVRIMGDRIG